MGGGHANHSRLRGKAPIAKLRRTKLESRTVQSSSTRIYDEIFEPLSTSRFIASTMECAGHDSEEDAECEAEEHAEHEPDPHDPQCSLHPHMPFLRKERMERHTHAITTARTKAVDTFTRFTDPFRKRERGGRSSGIYPRSAAWS